LTYYSGGMKLSAYNLTVSGSNLRAASTGYYEFFGGKMIKNAGGYINQDRLGSIGKFFPYGQERPSATANGKEKFATYFRDSETGLDYADNRYHSSGDGRFLTPDPAGDGSNWYAYAGGDPVNNIDPSGLKYCLDGTCVPDAACAMYGFGDPGTTGICNFSNYVDETSITVIEQITPTPTTTTPLCNSVTCDPRSITNTGIPTPGSGGGSGGTTTTTTPTTTTTTPTEVTHSCPAGWEYMYSNITRQWGCDVPIGNNEEFIRAMEYRLSNASLSSVYMGIGNLGLCILGVATAESGTGAGIAVVACGFTLFGEAGIGQ
jgi:RHS repeat-associated protein